MKISIFWFRRDLRIEDNCGLYHALKSPFPVLPIFIFDTNILNQLEEKKDARVEFILNQLISLQQKFKEKRTSLNIQIGTPEKVYKKILAEFEVQGIYTNEDYEPYAIQRDLRIQQLAEAKGIEFHSYKDQVIFAKNEILNDSGLPYKVYTHYKNKWKSLLLADMIKSFPSQKGENYFKTKSFQFPTLEEIGFKKSEIQIPSNEINLTIINSYDQTRDFPYLNSGTTKLGIHLRFGTLSVRKAVRTAFKSNETWLHELIWREFFMQLLYHFPQVVQEPFNKKFKNLPWRYSEEDFMKWCAGKTGYPLVDAGMRELNATGFMHNRVRMVCASFLTKHLLLDWRLGERYFADKLLDYELASNNGNWQWCAGTGADAQPFFRIFNPTNQQVKFDPNFSYIKRWVPEFGTDKYPKPMVEHKFAVERAKKAFNIIK
jgi:deoxyribodipyrimidine photo-lyase